MHLRLTIAATVAAAGIALIAGAASASAAEAPGPETSVPATSSISAIQTAAAEECELLGGDVAACLASAPRVEVVVHDSADLP